MPIHLDVVDSVYNQPGLAQLVLAEMLLKSVLLLRVCCMPIHLDSAEVSEVQVPT